MSKGIPNIGNTCYFNTAIQCLAHVPMLTNKFLNDGPYTGDCALTREYSLFIRQLWAHQDLDPRALFTTFHTRFPQFTPGHQHDTHEAVLAIIDALEKSLGVEYMKTIFYGKEDQIVTYPGGTSTRPSEFSALFVESPHKLSNYSKHIILSEYEDDAGKKYHAAALQTVIRATPHCLMVVFTQKCPVEQVPLKFEGAHLFGIVIHAGISQGGHYAAFLKHRGQWQLFDDDAVSPMEPRGICSMAWYKKFV